MNRTIQYIIPVVLLLACKRDFLEIQPKGKLIARTVNDYDLLLNNSSLTVINADAQVILGDEVTAFNTYYTASDLRSKRLFAWMDTIYQPNQTVPELAVPLQNIYLYNKIINEVMGAEEGDEQRKRSIMAEAMAGRAWTNFLLISYYGKPYTAASASKDPGFPIITTADINESKFTRATVQQVYDFIIKDLMEAIPLLPEKVTYRIRMSKVAAEALLGKIYVFMGRYQDALPLLNNAITGAAASPLAIRLYDYNTAFSTGGVFLPMSMFGPAVPTIDRNEENFYSKAFNNGKGYVSSDFVLSPAAVALYGATDLRLKFFSAMPFPVGAPFPKNMLRRAGGTPATYFGMLLPDVYLLRAECKARLNDLEGAVTDVEYLRAKRMPSADAPIPATIAGDRTALIAYIIEERIREFALTGFRWFDMRRLSVDPLFSANVYKHQLYGADGNILLEYILRPERFALRFPETLMEQNPGMENNP